jgi:hypothetical protein
VRTLFNPRKGFLDTSGPNKPESCDFEVDKVELRAGGVEFEHDTTSSCNPCTNCVGQLSL